MVGNLSIFVGEEPSSPAFSFDKHHIVSVDTLNSVNLVGDDLPVDTFTPTVIHTYQTSGAFIPTDYSAFLTSEGDVLCGAQTSNPLKIKYGTPVWFYNGSTLLGKYYFKNAKRNKTNEYTLNCISAMGLLDKQKHKGGVYSGTSFGIIADDILDGTNIDYYIDSDIADIPVYGWLPYASKRENLKQLLFAYNVSVLKDPNGQVHFAWLATSDPTDTVFLDADDIYEGGDCSTQSVPSRIEVTEHSYRDATGISDPITNVKLEGQEYTVLFDNTKSMEPANSKLVDFDTAPVIPWTLMADPDIKGSTLSVEERGVNCAVVSGQGVLIGIPYAHGEYTYGLDNDAAEEENVLTTSDCTLISLQNSDFVARRLMRYICDAEEISNEITVDSERCGTRYSLTSPFREESTGYLTEMNISSSSKLKAAAKFISNYIPVTDARLYSGDILLYHFGQAGTDGVFNTPSEVMNRPVEERRLRVLMAGGGDGGEAGNDGGDGSDGDFTDATGIATDQVSGGQGGKGGEGGKGGKIRILDLKGEQVQASFSYHLGRGGDGAYCSSSGINMYSSSVQYYFGDKVQYRTKYYRCIQMPLGPESWNPAHWEEILVEPTEGEATTFGNWSTQLGASPAEYGVASLFDGTKIISLSGTKGVDGGNGGRYYNETFADIDGSQEVEYYDKDSAVHIIHPSIPWTGKQSAVFAAFGFYGNAQNGYPGGASASSDGNQGYPAYLAPVAFRPQTGETIGYCAGGAGGAGADAQIVSVSVNPAQGGQGGNGGGGGGQGGSASVYNYNPDTVQISGCQDWDPSFHFYSGGKGGKGSPGNNGSSGAILIYY